MFDALAEFTHRMMDKYPVLRASASIHRARCWDSERRDWVTRDLYLPHVGGKPLLLVPEEWATGNLLMSAGRFYSTTVLSYVQGEYTSVGVNGRLNKPTKRALRDGGAAPVGRVTNIETTMRAMANTLDLVAEFESFVASKHGQAA
ncbi:hypothetical protein GCM10023197_35610 [Gordonia humi]